MHPDNHQARNPVTRVEILDQRSDPKAIGSCEIPELHQHDLADQRVATGLFALNPGKIVRDGRRCRALTGRQKKWRGGRGSLSAKAVPLARVDLWRGDVGSTERDQYHRHRHPRAVRRNAAGAAGPHGMPLTPEAPNAE
jgi:hypothetical protein